MLKSHSLVLYVSAAGNDKWSGTLRRPAAGATDGPLATLDAARRRVAELKARGALAGPVEVLVEPGRYALTHTLVFTPQDSWPVTFRPAGPGMVQISGGIALGGWKTEEVNGRLAWVTQAPECLTELRSLYVGGRRAVRPRLPRRGTFRTTELTPEFDVRPSWSGALADGWRVLPSDVPALRNIEDVDAVFLHLWVDDRLPLKGFDQATGLMRSRLLPTHPLKTDYNATYGTYYLDNVFEALTEPGDFYFERSSRRVYYLPRKGERPESTEVIAPVVKQLMRFAGDARANRYVEHIVFEGITFAHTDWDQRPFMDTRRNAPPGEICGAYQAASNVPSVVELEAARYCTIRDCVFEHLGYYAIGVLGGCAGVRIVGNTMRDLGAGGVKVNGADAAGPREERTRFIHITDNHIHACGRSYAAAVGVLVMHASEVAIRHNHIHDLYYSGVSVGWVWGGGDSVCQGNLIEKNHIHNLGQGWLSDMGGIYTLGRQPGTIIRGNVIHDITKVHYGAWCIYPDEGSAHMVIEKNLCYDTNAEIFHQHYGRENIVRNNIFAFGAQFLTQLGRSDSPRGEYAFTFTRNIFVTDGKPLFSTGYGCKLEERPFLSDNNLVWDISKKLTAGECRVAKRKFSWKQWQELEQDRGSRVADPMFANAEKRDFRLSSKSPALKVGFEPLDLRDVGPRPRSKRD
jgi:hypothetical protein